MPYGKSAGSSEGLPLVGLSLLPVILPGAFSFPWFTPGKGFTAGQHPPHRREPSISPARVFPLLPCPIPGTAPQQWGMIPLCTQDPPLDAGSCRPVQGITPGAGTGAALAVMNTQEMPNKQKPRLFSFSFPKVCFHFLKTLKMLSSFWE